MRTEEDTLARAQKKCSKERTPLTHVLRTVILDSLYSLILSNLITRIATKIKRIFAISILINISISALSTSSANINFICYRVARKDTVYQ